MTLNRLGQLRLYSFLDLLLLLQAAHASSRTQGGVICLWFGFLLYLEYRHQHNYRSGFPPILWVVLTFLGLWFYHRPEGFLFALFSVCYTAKDRGKWGLTAAVWRGLQSLVLVAGITGYQIALPWLAAGLIAFRNILGDVRDVESDRKERIETLPIQLGLRGHYPWVHLWGTWLTSTIWWLHAVLPAHWLITILVLEYGCYQLTPRASVRSEEAQTENDE